MLKKVSLRLEPDILKELDSMVDFIRVRNRSDAIRHVLKQSMRHEKIAVILSKGTDVPRQGLKSMMLLEDGQYNLLSELGHGRTLFEEQFSLLKRNGFSQVFVVTLPEVNRKIRRMAGHVKGLYLVDNKEGLRTMDALRLLKGKVDSDFLVFYGHDYPVMDLSGIFRHHIQNDHYVTLNLTWGGPESLNYTEVEGTKIVKFIEKRQKVSHLTYNAVFVASPRFLGEKGHSITYDVFPRLSRSGQLDGFITKARIPRLTSVSGKADILGLLARSKFL